jgi:hypothetical protein
VVVIIKTLHLQGSARVKLRTYRRVRLDPDFVLVNTSQYKNLPSGTIARPRYAEEICQERRICDTSTIRCGLRPVNRLFGVVARQCCTHLHIRSYGMIGELSAGICDC